MKKYILFATMLASFQCTYHWGNFKTYSLDSPKDVERFSEVVSGSDCSAFLGWHSNNLAQATRNAIKKAPGYTGLADVSIGQQTYYIVNCISVTGTPVKTKETLPAKK
jgi:hypothetical protein